MIVETKPQLAPTTTANGAEQPDVQPPGGPSVEIKPAVPAQLRAIELRAQLAAEADRLNAVLRCPEAAVRADFADRLQSCSAFEEGKPAGVCQSDGHYICQECKHLCPAKTHAGVEAARIAAEDWFQEEEARRKQWHVNYEMNRERELMATLNRTGP
jgi:hypothetical protein